MSGTNPASGDYLVTDPGALPLRGGSQDPISIVPLVGGPAYFTALQHELSQCTNALDTVILSAWCIDKDFAFSNASDLGQLFPLLNQLAGQGVRVRILVFTTRLVSNFTNSPDTAVLGPLVAVLSERIFGMARSNTLQVRDIRQTYPNLDGHILLDWTGQRSHHTKAVVINAQSANRNPVAFVGGMDPLSSRLNSSWHDVAWQVNGKLVGDVWSTLDTRWVEAAALDMQKSYILLPFGGGPAAFGFVNDFAVGTVPEPPPTDLTPFPPLADATSTAQVLRSIGDDKTPFGSWVPLIEPTPWQYFPHAGYQEICACLTKALGKAASFIYVEDQTFNSPVEDLGLAWGMEKLSPPLVAAALNGVVVIMVVGFVADGPGAVAETMQQPFIDYLITPFQRGQIKKSGGAIKLYGVNNVTVHSKAVMVDDVFACVGSANFADCSMTGMDTELSIAVVAGAGPTNPPLTLRTQLWADIFGGGVAAVTAAGANAVSQWNALVAANSSKVVPILPPP